MDPKQEPESPPEDAAGESVDVELVADDTLEATIEAKPYDATAIPVDDLTEPTGDAPHVELVAGSSPGFTTKTTSLLLLRLRAVATALLVIYAAVLVWVFINHAERVGSFVMDRNLTIARLVLLGGVLIFLHARSSYSQGMLRTVEYTLFGVLTLVWIFGRYREIVVDIGAGDVTELLVTGRESLIGLFMLMLVHGMFIPHHWKGTAKVVVPMAFAPIITLVLLRTLHPGLIDEAAELLSVRNVTTSLLVVGVGAALATYCSGILNSLRTEVHQARRYGQYQLLGRIGGGGMGEVFLAEHALMKRPCAMKLIHAEAAQDPLAMARFEREVKSTAQLTHPNTIQIFDYGHTDDGTFYYVMEHLPGLSLAELMRYHGRLPVGRAIYLLRQACSALAEAHDAGLVHRDLKPANLFVSQRGGLCDFLKVLDFGIVKVNNPASAQLTTDQSVSGTPLYMSPEQAMGDQGLDGRCDLYALGAVAYQMVTGRTPFVGDNSMMIMAQHINGEVPPPSQFADDIPKDLEQIIMKCLQKDPNARFTNAMQLDQALAGCAAVKEWNEGQAAVWWEEQFVSAEATAV